MRLIIVPAPLLIELSDEERKEFHRLCRSGKTESRLKERLSIVLLADEGLTNGEIAQQLPISAHKASRWRKRFYEQGLEGIRKDMPRGWSQFGSSHTPYGALRKLIIKKTTTEKPKNATHWSTRTMAEEVGTNSVFVSRVWREHGLKPHLTKQFKLSNDPLFEEKLADVVGLYLTT